jgi:hypothetical protein
MDNIRLKIKNYNKSEKKKKTIQFWNTIHTAFIHNTIEMWKITKEGGSILVTFGQITTQLKCKKKIRIQEGGMNF